MEEDSGGCREGGEVEASYRFTVLTREHMFFHLSVRENNQCIAPPTVDVCSRSSTFPVVPCRTGRYRQPSRRVVLLFQSRPSTACSSLAPRRGRAPNFPKLVERREALCKRHDGRRKGCTVRWAHENYRAIHTQTQFVKDNTRALLKVRCFFLWRSTERQSPHSHSARALLEAQVASLLGLRGCICFKFVHWHTLDVIVALVCAGWPGPCPSLRRRSPVAARSRRSRWRRSRRARQPSVAPSSHNCIVYSIT